MLAAILAFLAFIAVMTVLYRFTVKRVGDRVGRFVHDRHKQAEQILDGHRVPEDWQQEVREAGLGEDRARRRYLRHLDKLARYFEKSPLVDTEETREVILDGLADAAEAWEANPLAPFLTTESSKLPDQPDSSEA